MSLQNPRLGTSPVRITLIVLAGLMAAFAVLVPAQSEAKAKKKKDPKVTVMTRNLFLGADLSPAIGAATLGEAIDGAGEIYNELESTDFPERAPLLGEEINESKADLVGLQEVALWRTQTPSDLGWTESGGAGEPATDVKYDFLAELMKHIGDDYKVVGTQNEFDAELPVDQDGSDATGGAFGAELDARLTMRDVILVRKGSKVKVDKKSLDMDHFENLYTANVGGVQITAQRGWLSVDAKVKGDKKTKGGKFHFVNTHLEAFGDPSIREAQAREMFDKGGPLQTKQQLIFLGDINSGGPKDKVGTGFTEDGDEGAYNAFTKDFGLTNLGARQTCCYPSLFADDLDGYELDHTVDHVFVKPKLKQLDAYVTGDDPTVTTESGLLSSDHGGLVSTIKLSKPKK